MLLPVKIIPAAAASVVLVTLLAKMWLCHLKARRNLKSSSDGNVNDVTRFIHIHIVTTDAVKPTLV
ncbi:hypothetical protein DPMN_022136 [Dreissena polymorpha]|uniref:Uncharacterized protein n=1 Tax=Dreissena polymorpha TaxID=45954 RepID=A0A9D4NNX0_DREPO|nr:hypothetical protein DPMN_022136 [Dreissena polymorpha]